MASAIIELRARTKKLEDGLRRVRNQSKRAGTSLDKTSASASGLARAGRLVGTAFAGVGFALLARSVINIGKEFEILTARLATFEGSTEAAGMALSRLNKVAQTTPFQLQDVINSFIQLRSAGLAPTNRELVALGNVAAAFGQTMNQVANVVFRGASSTELFYNLGITARKEGDKLRVTYDGVTRTIEATNKGIQEYLVSLGETRFAGAALEQAKGLTAAFSNLSGNLQFTIDKLGNASGLFQRISTVLNAVSGEIIALGGASDGLFEVFDPIAFELSTTKIIGQIYAFAGSVSGVFDSEEAKLAGTVIGALLLGRTFIGKIGLALAFDSGISDFLEGKGFDPISAELIETIVEVFVATRVLRALTGFGLAAGTAVRTPLIAALLSAFSNPAVLVAAAALAGYFVLDAIADQGEKGNARLNLTQTTRELDRETTELNRLFMSGVDLSDSQQKAYDAQLLFVQELIEKMNGLIARVEANAPGTSQSVIDSARRPLGAQIGGFISGSGTGTSDSIAARLSNGEFVVKASQTKKYRALLENINEGSQGFANGGYVSKYAKRFQSGGIASGPGGGFFEGTDFDAFRGFSDAQDRLLETTLKNIEATQRQIEQRRFNRDEILALIATTEEGSAEQEFYKRRLEENNRALAAGEIQLQGYSDGLLNLNETLSQGGGFFSSDDIKGIAGDLSRGISNVLTGKSDESIGSVFKRSAQNYLAKQLESSLNDLFSTILNNVNTGGAEGGGIGSFFSSLFGGIFHNGGVVPGRPGQEVPILAMAGETVTPAGQSSGSNMTTNVYNLEITGNVDDRAIAQIRSIITRSPKEVSQSANAGKQSTKGIGKGR